jgi:hypothetical protein
MGASALLGATVPPIPATATFVLDEASDSTELRATIVVAADPTGEGPTRRAPRVPLLLPGAHSALATTGTHAIDLWIDPGAARIVALGTAQGVHWSVPPGRPLEVDARDRAAEEGGASP